MPLKNFAARDTIMVKFTYCGWNFLYSITMQMCIFTFVFTSFYKQFVYRVEFDKISEFLRLSSHAKSSTEHLCKIIFS